MFKKENENKEIEIKGIPEIPEDSIESSFKLTIERVTKSKTVSTSSFFIDLETGEVIKEPYNKKEGSKYERITYPTGDISTSTSEEKLYEQELNSLDIGELATYINRVR